MICNVNHTGVGLMIVSPKKILLGARNHVTGRYGNIRIPTQVVRRDRCRRAQTARHLISWNTALARSL